MLAKIKLLVEQLNSMLLWIGKNMRLVAYPVGSIYMSLSSTNPSQLFGGTWQQIQDTFLLAAGSTYKAGTTGGEATHKLTIAEMPSHNHDVARFMNGAAGKERWTPVMAEGYDLVGVTSTGGGKAHNNMPPYLAVYCWRRVA